MIFTFSHGNNTCRRLSGEHLAAPPIWHLKHPDCRARCTLCTASQPGPACRPLQCARPTCSFCALRLRRASASRSSCCSCLSLAAVSCSMSSSKPYSPAGSMAERMEIHTGSLLTNAVYVFDVRQTELVLQDALAELQCNSVCVGVIASPDQEQLLKLRQDSTSAAAAVCTHGMVAVDSNSCLCWHAAAASSVHWLRPLTLHEALLLVNVHVGGLVGVKLTLEALEVVIPNALLCCSLCKLQHLRLLLLGCCRQLLHSPAVICTGNALFIHIISLFPAATRGFEGWSQDICSAVPPTAVLMS